MNKFPFICIEKVNNYWKTPDKLRKIYTNNNEDCKQEILYILLKNIDTVCELNMLKLFSKKQYHFFLKEVNILINNSSKTVFHNL